MTVLTRLVEDCDRRRIRRPLNNDELARLLTVAEAHGRKAWYLAAALAGLRRSELRKLTWADVDSELGTITIRDGKAKREDIIPMHPQLADELRCIRPLTVHPKVRVFPTEVTNETRLKDFLRAKLARRVVVLSADGKPTLVGKGNGRRPKTRMGTEDDEGRVIDLHELRTTLGTQLARSGIAPQIAQRIMRHADYKTTLKHYTVLGLTDTAGAIRQLPTIDSATTQERAIATGTHDGCPREGARNRLPQQNPQQSGCFSQRCNANECELTDTSVEVRMNAQVKLPAIVSDDLRGHAKPFNTAGDATRTRNIQLGRLMLYH